MKILRNVIAPLLILMMVLLSGTSRAVNTITVTNPGDIGPGTLREVIAGALPGDTINFATALGTITLTSGELVIDKDLTISGPGSGNLTITRSAAGGTPEFRIFNVTSSTGTITISGLTVSNGLALFGGGINNDGTLALDDCVITGNIAKVSGGGVANRLNGSSLTMNNCFVTGDSVATSGNDGWGGGVYNGPGTMNVTNSTVNNNSVQTDAGHDAYGGGVYNEGALRIIGSKISGNHSTGGGNADGGGGGIFNDNQLTLTTSTVDSNTATGGAGSGPGRGYGGGIANGGGDTTLDRSTVSGNFAVGGAGSDNSSGGSGEGGGIAVDFDFVTVDTSTVSGNTSSGGAGNGSGGPGSSHGGGIFNHSFAALFNSTVATNVVNVVPTGFTGDGGGIYNINLLELKNTIVAANTATVDFFNEPYDPNVPAGLSGSIFSDGFNLIGTTNGSFDPSDQLDVAAAAVRLGPLQDNGGPTFTHALLCGSPAINAGDNTGAPDPDTDQRGIGFPRPESVGGVIDIGAYEYKNIPPAIISCPAPITVDCASASCQATLVVGVADGDPLTVVWSVDGTPAHTSLVPAGGNSASFTASFAVGTHAITLSVSDPSSCLATCSTTVGVRPSVVLTHPQINIVKTTNNTNNDSAPGIQVLAGSTVTWTYIVTNPGDEPLTSVSVVDDHIGSLSAHTGDANSNGLLDVGETWTYTAAGTAVRGQYSNLGTAAGTGNVSNKAVTHSNPDFYFGLNPAINIVVLTNGTNNDAPTGPHLVEGSDVVWTYTVTNPGSEPVKNVTVTDSVVGSITGLTGGDANNNGLLDPGETWTYTKGAVVVLGQYENIGTANGTGNVTNKPVTSSNPDHYFGEPWATPCPDGVFSYGSDGNVIDPATGDLKITYDQFPAPNDNSYGVNAIGWPNGHIFKDLVQSDHAGFQVLNPSRTVMLSFDIDYLTATPVTAGTPSGYKSLGPFGGDGAVLRGTLTPSDLTWDTSLARNLNNLGYCRVVNSAANCTTGGVNLLLDSPPADLNYVPSNPALL